MKKVPIRKKYPPKKRKRVCKRCGAVGAVVLSTGICEHCNDELCDELAGRK